MYGWIFFNYKPEVILYVMQDDKREKSNRSSESEGCVGLIIIRVTLIQEPSSVLMSSYL